MKGGLLALCVMTSVAAAETSTTVRFEAAGACELTALEPRTNELLGRVAITADARARIAIASEQTGDAVSATLTFSDEAGVTKSSRTITAASCDELAESIAVVLSLVLREPAPEPAPAPPPPAPPAPAVTTGVDTTFTLVPARHSPIAIELGATIGSALDSAIVIGGRLERRALAFGVELAVAMPKTVEVLGGAVHVTSARLAGAGCARLNQFSGCWLVIGGAVRGSGEDLMDARSATGALVGVGARVEWRQPVSRRAGVRVFGAVEQLLVRPSFLVGDTAVFSSAERQAWLGAGVFLHIP